MQRTINNNVIKLYQDFSKNSHLLKYFYLIDAAVGGVLRYGLLFFLSY